jgi:bifunctional non-homologous end joining protein LigD
MSQSRGNPPQTRAERRLAEYRRKRSADRTPEPFGRGGGLRPGQFVVQQHAATRMHHDLRLEWEGVLLSWAVPKGPSLDPAEKRLAVQVEDHPVDYAEFEGVIPEGNYGAGAVILWDRGRWQPVEDPTAGLERGKLLFDLEGYKLRGRFTLVRTKGRASSGREWLLIKKPDAWAHQGELEASFDQSILSGTTLAELSSGADRAAPVRAKAAAMGAKPGRVEASRLRPMLAEKIDAPFDREGWLFEVKIDGYRILAARRGGQARLWTRNGRSAEARFPEVASAVSALPFEDLVLDGEVAVTDREGRPRFQRLQQRALLHRARDIERALTQHPATYFVFDVLAVEGLDLRTLALVDRKALLRDLLPARGPLRYVEHFETRGKEVYANVERLGLEGMVAKRANAAYRSGRSPLWKKLRSLATDDFVIVGYTRPRGSRRGFGALHLAACEAGQLVYCGRVGTGFREADLAAFREALEPLARERPPCDGYAGGAGDTVWVEPQHVCEVRYTEITDDGLLRQPAFLRLRPDKAPAECERPRRAAEMESLPMQETPAAADREVPFTHLDKVFWPAEGYTKGDLIGYHRAIAPWLLPYLKDRPLVMTRYPDGIDGKSFFQKDAPSWAPEWVRTETMWSEHAERDVHYFVCDDVESLLYVINMGTIPLHIWSSRVADLAHPDWCILDLDPKGAPFADVVRVARAIRDLCGELELPALPKTSGSTGLHVLIPLGGRLTYAQSRSLAELLARVVVQQLPEIATVARPLRSRAGRVYVDYLQNGHGQLLVAPFSVRPLPGAPVSMPLRWREVSPRLDIGRFTMRNARSRMRRLGEDPLAPVLGAGADVVRALSRLAERAE